MTLKQLQYVVTVAEEGNITGAAKRLYIAQPSLTAAIHELENEFGITIFIRSNKGIKLTSEGEEFLGYARQVLDQTELIEERYTMTLKQLQYVVTVAEEGNITGAANRLYIAQPSLTAAIHYL